jgi:haloalkane dehalogenase
MLEVHSYTEMRRYAQLKNCRVAYVQQGGGPTALFLHGFPLNGFQWRGVIPRLEHYRRCIAPHFMGLGYTEAAETQEISPETQAEMLAEFLVGLEIKIVDILASDTGGEVAQLVAHYPNRADSFARLLANKEAARAQRGLGLSMHTLRIRTLFTGGRRF